MEQPSTQQLSSATAPSGQPPVQFAIASGQVPAVYQNPGMGQPAAFVAGQPPAGYAAVPQALPGYQHVHQQQLQQFWNTQMQEIEQVNDFRTHQLPLARIKKIMKADEDVRMIAAEAPVLFSKACEMFILELTLRSWINTEENKRRTLQKNDIAAAISRTDIFDFLVDIVPRDEQESLGMPRPGLPVGAPGEIPYGGMYYMAQPQAPGAVPVMNQPPQTMIAPPAIIVGRPAMAVDPAMYRPGIPYTPQPVVPPHNWQPKAQDSKSEAAETSS